MLRSIFSFNESSHPTSLALVQTRDAGKMTTYSLPTQKVAVSRSNFLHVAAILSSAIVALGHAGPVSADPLAKSPATQTSGEDSMARCQQLYGLWSRHNTDGYARPLDARMGLEDCQKGNISSGVATLKRALERAQIPIPSAESAAAEPAAPLKSRGEKRRLSQ
jgi:hypothetical protein